MHKRGFGCFIEEMRTRSEAGAREYGNKSFDAHPSKTLDEIQEEIVDQAVWSWIAWENIERLKRDLADIERRYGHVAEIH